MYFGIMRNKISELIRQKIAEKANYRCEYYLLPEKLSYYAFHIDHIICLKHGGNSDIENLAYSCPDCNANKGSDIATFNQSNQIVQFFNPRTDIWENHFKIIEGFIEGKTEIGKGTVNIFKINDIERLIFRKQIIEIGQF